jgi:hypothetical protein
MNTILRRHMTAVATIGAVVVAVAVGCSNADAPNASPATSTAPPVSGSSQTASPATAKPIDVTVAPEGETTVRPGGPPIRFRVTLANNGADIAKVGMVVSLGHCSCGPPVRRRLVSSHHRRDELTGHAHAAATATATRTSSPPTQSQRKKSAGGFLALDVGESGRQLGAFGRRRIPRQLAVLHDLGRRADRDRIVRDVALDHGV